MLSRILLSITFIFVSLIPASGIKERKTILLLHSYNQGLQWTDNLNYAISKALINDSLFYMDLRIEYMDSKHNQTDEYLHNFYHFFITKYRKTKIDLVISTDNNAFNFLSVYRDSLLNKPPVVFCGLNYVDTIPKGFTGIMEDIDIRSNIESILKIHPKYNKIYILIDHTVTGNVIRKKTEEIIATSFPKLKYHFLSDLTYAELRQKLKLLGSKDVLFLVTYNIDKAGDQISYDHILEYINPVCNAPIYGTWDFYLNKGIIGGKIVKAATHGNYAADIALKILNGTPVNSIPITSGPTEFIFDNHMIKKYKINKSRLPQNAIILNSPYTYFKENLLTIVFISVVFLLMLAVILVLVKLFNKEKHIRKTEHTFIQELKNKSNELEHALKLAEQSNELKSAFLSNLSHEIRTPMNAIVGFSDLLVSNSADKKMHEYVSIIRASSNQLLSIINDIIEMSMVDTNQVHLHFETMNVNETIDEVTTSFMVTMDPDSKVKIRKSLALSTNESNIITDSVKFKQILSNLISNALKFTETGYVDVGYYLSDDNLEFYVKDTGIGIDPKYHEEIFERFRRVENNDASLFRGLGIGLTLSQSFVKLLGGNIWLQSEPEQGSTFYFTIPYKKAFDSHKSEEEKSEIDLNNNLILICEDDENNLFYFKELFSKTNTNIVWAKNGKEAVKAVADNPSINLVLMDLKMPEMNGWEATKIIKEIRPQLPVIAQTAHALSLETSQLTKVGFDDYVTKPIKKGELFDKIARYIHQS